MLGPAAIPNGMRPTRPKDQRVSDDGGVFRSCAEGDSDDTFPSRSLTVFVVETSAENNKRSVRDRYALHVGGERNISCFLPLEDRHPTSA